MRLNFNELKKYEIKATDGHIGKVEDFYFEDNTWVLHYLVADTGNWLAENLVLLSPAKIENVNDKERQVSVQLSKKKIENSPPVQKDQPVSRQKEIELLKYYQDWPHYWVAFSQAPAPTLPVILPKQIKGDKGKSENDSSGKKDKKNDSHLRSCSEVIGYHLQATDGKIGHVENFVIDQENWDIEFLIIDTKNWIPMSKKVLISPKWIEKIEWATDEVKVNKTTEIIKNSPEYEESKPIFQEYIDILYEYYNLHE